MSDALVTSCELGRCIVRLGEDVGDSFPDTAEELEALAEHHRALEREHRARVEAAAPALDVLLDELEQAGQRFLTPRDPAFHRAAQEVECAGVGRVCVVIAAQPRLTPAERAAFASRVGSLFGSVSEQASDERGTLLDDVFSVLDAAGSTRRK